MIVVHVEVRNEDLAYTVIQHLMNNQLIYAAEYAQVKLFGSETEKHKIKGEKGFVIRATTKALLFQKIQKSLQKEFKKDIRALYATPIVYMDRKQAALLKSNTLAV